MQTARKAGYEITAEIIPFKTMNSGEKKAKDLQNETEKMSCFRTDVRYHCKDRDCDCWNECQKLIAVWMR